MIKAYYTKKYYRKTKDNNNKYFYIKTRNYKTCDTKNDYTPNDIKYNS